jgi:hypothetical protein
MNALLTINIVAFALFSWICVFKLVPASAISLCRYRLWRLRDELFDEIRNGKFDDGKQPRRLLLLVETTIQSVEETSALNLALFYISARKLPRPELFNFDELSTTDKECFDRHFDRFGQIMVKYVVGGTPSGWMSFVVIGPALLCVALAKRILRGNDDSGSLIQDTKSQFQERLETRVDSVVALMNKRNGHPRRSLYQSV